MDETSLFWKWVPERTSIHKEATSVPRFKVCVNTLYDILTTESPNEVILRTYPHRLATHDCIAKIFDISTSETLEKIMM
jgi:hypothetical protein